MKRRRNNIYFGVTDAPTGSVQCEQRRKQSAKAALLKLVLKKNRKPVRRKMIEVLQG